MQYGNIVDNLLELAKNNVTYVPIDGSISTYITNATAGDTLILAAGTYTVTADIPINKAICITGQGTNKTIITTTTAGLNVLNITSDNVTIQDLTVSDTASSGQSTAILVDGTAGTVFNNANLYNINVTITTTPGKIFGVWYKDAGGIMTNCHIDLSSTGSADSIVGIGHVNYSTGEAITNLYVYSCDLVVAGTSSANAVVGIDNETASSPVNFNTYVYNTTATVTCSGAAAGWGFASITGSAARLYLYNCTSNAKTYDLYTTSTAVLQVSNCTLINNTTSGTIAYLGTVRTKRAQIDGQIWATKYTCTVTLDWNNSSVQYIQLATGAQTFTFANPQDGARYTLILKQPASGAAGTVTWPGTVAWPGAVTPTLTPTNSRYDVITFVYDGTNTKYYGGVSYNYT